MPSPDRGSIWIVDLGIAAKVRPCLVLSVPPVSSDRQLVTLIPHTTSVWKTSYEVAVQSRFLSANGVFDAQQIMSVPQAKFIRRLGSIQPSQLTLVENAVKRWLAL